MPITIKTGDIVRADQEKKLYKIVHSFSPYLEDYAVPINGIHTIPGNSGVTYCESFAIGDHVLYLCQDSDVYMQNRVGWIIGKIPKDIAYRDDGSDGNPTLFTDLYNLSSRISPMISETKQDAGFLTHYSARGNFPIDVAQGDYTIRGENTVINLGDYNTIIKAGESELFLDSIFGVLTQSSNLYNRYTLGEITRTQCYKGSLVYTKKLIGDIVNGKLPESEALFPYREQFSTLLGGYREDVLDDKGRPIARISKNVDGSISVCAAKSVFIGRSSSADNYSLSNTDAIVAGEPLNIPKKEDILAPVREDSAWVGDSIIDGSYDPLGNILDMADEGSWEAAEASTVVKYLDTYTREEHAVTVPDSGINFLPDGSIVIRDAWGSEIRMDHGNIQISSANNLTTIAGRDQLAITSGMHTVTAGSGVEVGAGSGDIAINAPGTMRIAAEELTVSATDMTEHIKNNKVSKCRSTFTDSIRCENRVSGPCTIVAAGLHLVGQESAVIASRYCGATLAANSISIGAPVMELYGTVRTNKGKYTIKDVATTDYKSYDITVQNSSASIIVGGDIMTEGAIVCNDHIQTAGGVYADVVAAHDVPSAMGVAGIYKLKNAPKKQKNLKTKTDKEYSAGVNRELAKTVREMFKDSVMNDITRVFRSVSKAFKIIQPIFSLYKGKNVTTPSTCSDGRGGISYIYPGKDFWTKDGLVTVNKDRIDMTETRDISVTGCSQLRLNTPNNIEED